METGQLEKYYAERAKEYDAIYLKPERQEDIRLLASQLTQLLAGRSVLEVACGTGYWTQFFGPTAASVTATDYNNEVLEIAKARLTNLPTVALAQADAFRLADFGQQFQAGFAGFWWSHLEKSRIGLFLDGLHQTVVPGGRIVFADNLYVPGSSTPISRTDAEGNTYQVRRLEDGWTFEVLKNFPSEEEFRRAIGNRGQNVEFQRLTYFWCGWYDLPI